MVEPGGLVTCGPYSEVPAWGQSISKQDNAGVGKASSPEESIFYNIWYTMETAAQVGWLLHTLKVLCLHGWQLPPCRKFAFSPSSACISSPASADRTTHRTKPCSQGQRHKPRGREQDLGLHQTKQSLVTANHFSCDTKCWSFSLSCIHERAEIAQVSPLLFFNWLCHSKTDTSAISSSLHIHLASSPQQGKNLWQCHLSSLLKMVVGTKPKFSERGSKYFREKQCILIFGVFNMRHIQPIPFSCSIPADLMAANGKLLRLSGGWFEHFSLLQVENKWCGLWTSLCSFRVMR